MIGFGLDCQSILKSGFGFSIIFLRWIWIGLTIQKNWIEQYPGNIIHSALDVVTLRTDCLSGRG